MLCLAAIDSFGVFLGMQELVSIQRQKQLNKQHEPVGGNSEAA
jgi:hypothetical protein